jgi:hypothetical protein
VLRLREGNAWPLAGMWLGVLVVMVTGSSLTFHWWVFLIQIILFVAALYSTIRLVEK